MYNVIVIVNLKDQAKTNIHKYTNFRSMRRKTVAEIVSKIYLIKDLTIACIMDTQHRACI